jgi:hypothetical protein
MEIATGNAQSHPTPLPLDTSATPGVVAPTVIFSSGTEQGAVRDLTGERLSQLAASEAEISASQTYGMSADGGRRTHYLDAMNPAGPAEATDEMTLPQLPEQLVTPQPPLYPQGDQPGA